MLGVLCCAVLCALCGTVLRGTVLYSAVRSGALSGAVLCCAVLCCALLCCAAPCSIMNVTFGRDRSLGQVAVLLSEWFESFLRLVCNNFRVITDGKT